jgi:hypothetical protein
MCSWHILGVVSSKRGFEEILMTILIPSRALSLDSPVGRVRTEGEIGADLPESKRMTAGDYGKMQDVEHMGPGALKRNLSRREQVRAS